MSEKEEIINELNNVLKKVYGYNEVGDTTIYYDEDYVPILNVTVNNDDYTFEFLDNNKKYLLRRI